MEFTYAGYDPDGGVTLEDALRFSVIAEEINRYFESQGAHFEDGMIVIGWDPMASVLRFDRGIHTNLK